MLFFFQIDFSFPSIFVHIDDHQGLKPPISPLNGNSETMNLGPLLQSSLKSTCTTFTRSLESFFVARFFITEAESPNEPLKRKICDYELSCLSSKHPRLN